MNFYRNIIKDAWRITWRYKFLWFFGLFAALLGNGGEYEILFRNIDAISNQQKFITNLQNLTQSGRLSSLWQNFTSYFTNNSLISVIVLLIILAIFAFIIWLVIVSQAGLIDSAFKLLTNQKANIESGFRTGRKYFLPLFILNLISKVIIYGLFIVVGIPLVIFFLAKGGLGWNVLFILVSFIIMVPLAIAISFIIKYASAYVIYKQEDFRKAFKDGWQLFQKNWLVSIEMAFIILFINILFGLAIIIVIGLLSVPFVLLGLILYLVGASVSFSAISLVVVIIFLLLIFLLGAFISAFQWVAWISLFKSLIEKKGVSKIIRIFSRLPDHINKT